MKKFNDKFLIASFTATTAFIAIILACISYYSILIVEPEFDALLIKAEKTADIAPEEAKTIYNRLFALAADPQLFARYEYFDKVIGKNDEASLKLLLKINSTGGSFTRDNLKDFSILLERRKSGSRLGRNTMIFFFILSFTGSIFYLNERRQVKNWKPDKPAKKK